MKNGDRLIVLGTGTCQLGVGRATSSCLIDLPDQRILFDIGRGIADRLAELGVKNDQIENLIISHFHPDHVSDLIPFLHAASWSRCDPRSKDLTVFGPTGIDTLVHRVLGLFGPNELTREHFQVHAKPIQAGRHKIGSFSFEFVDLPPASNHGVRYSRHGNTFAITADSYFHDQEVQFLMGVDVAIVDAGHLARNDLIELAVRAQPRTMVCSHLYSEIDERKLQIDARKGGYKGKLMVAKDLLVVSHRTLEFSRLSPRPRSSDS